ncbi:MAG: Flp pilus assembly complex ATPase component TadA [Azoarcus sp.]|jgi:general secretion pathway protein E/type IV pilus assembly protein PilB|nr:Flp pilus assembly complex ATPase component TadA [Azoarcus sp.]
MNAPIGQTLAAAGLIGQDQLHIALHEQHRRHRPFGRVCVELGFIDEAMLRDALSQRLGRQAVKLADVVVDPTTLALVPETLARRHDLLPIAHDPESGALTVAMADAHDIVALDALRAAGLRPLPAIAAEAEIRDAIDRLYGQKIAIDDILRELESATPAALHAATRENGHPLKRLVDALLVEAVKAGASDIHFEPEAGFLRVRYRIDGILHQTRALHLEHWPPMAVRIKVMAGLNVAESRAPQDGRVSLTVAGRPVDFRVSTLPTLHGENVVLRILDRQRGIVPLDEIGFDAARLALAQRMLARPQGLILVTGPTGSGKTTTLYAMLDRLDDEAVNIMTLEDPVEYPMARLRQTPMGEVARIDFAAGVRAMLRQDPDILLVGEVRDAETAAMALRAAMTGHRVFATLHANDTIGALPRLVDLGLRPQMLAGNLNGVVAQRLVRRLCPACKRLAPASEKERQLLGLPPAADGEISLAHAVGCPACGGRGYRERLPLFEMLCIDDALDECIAAAASPAAIARVARARGYLDLADDGRRKALAGDTSPQELLRVLGPLAPASERP